MLPLIGAAALLQTGFDAFDAVSPVTVTFGGTDSTVDTNAIAAMEVGDGLIVFGGGGRSDASVRTANVPTGDGWIAPAMTEEYDENYVDAHVVNLSCAWANADSAGSSRNFVQTWSGTLYGPTAGAIRIPRGVSFVRKSALVSKGASGTSLTPNFGTPSAATSLNFLHVYNRGAVTFAVAGGWTEIMNQNNSSNSAMGLFAKVGAITSQTVTGLAGASYGAAILTEWTRP